MKFVLVSSLVFLASSMAFVQARQADVYLSMGQEIMLRPYQTEVVHCGNGPAAPVVGNAGKVTRIQDVYGNVTFHIKAGADELEVRPNLDAAIESVKNLRKNTLCNTDASATGSCSLKRVQDVYGNVTYPVKIGEALADVRSNLDAASNVVRQLREALLCQ